MYQKYKKIKQKALYSIGLIGIRDITKVVVGGVSSFNIADQVILPPFSLKNVRDLYAQYTEETNQPFTEKAIKKAIQLLLREKNDHFDNLYEKAKPYIETFIEIVFDQVKYKHNHEEQSWFEQFGLKKDKNGSAVVANNIYKSRFVEIFFDEANAPVPGEVPMREYRLPDGRLHMELILLDFDQYISRIGVKAFYREDKHYEKTGQFLLTAWLYQFVRGGKGELRYEVLSGF